jgi:hypothetical protein
MELYATSEPGEEGEEAPVVAELHHTIHPNGTPVEPSMPGGEWFDTIQKRIG